MIALISLLFFAVLSVSWCGDQPALDSLFDGSSPQQGILDSFPEGRRLEGVNGPRHSFQINANSTRLALSAHGFALWDLRTGKKVSTLLKEDPQALYSVGEFSPDGRRSILFDLPNKTAVLWDIDAQRPLHRYKAGYSVFSSDGRKLSAVKSGDPTVEIRSSLTGRRLKVFRHGEAVRAALFSPDGSKVLTVLKDKALLWQYRGGKRLYTLDGNHEPLFHYYCIFSPDGSLILTLSRNRAVIWETNTGKQRFSFEGHFYYSHFSLDGSKLISNLGGEIVTWDLRSGQKIRSFSVPGTQIVASPDGILAVTSGEGLVTTVWNMESSRVVRTLDGLEGHTFCFWNPDGRILVTDNRKENAVRVWKIVYTDSEIEDLQRHLSQPKEVPVKPSTIDEKKDFETADKRFKIWELFRIPS